MKKCTSNEFTRYKLPVNHRCEHVRVRVCLWCPVVCPVSCVLFPVMCSVWCVVCDLCCAMCCVLCVLWCSLVLLLMSAGGALCNRHIRCILVPHRARRVQASVALLHILVWCFVWDSEMTYTWWAYTLPSAVFWCRNGHVEYRPVPRELKSQFTIN